MSSNTPIRLLHQRHTRNALLALSALIGIAVYLELLGWRILTPEFSLSQAWNLSFIFGALNTVAGATFLGIVPIALRAIPRHTRHWSLSHPVLLWSIGAGVFLLAMAALVLWAP